MQHNLNILITIKSIKSIILADDDKKLSNFVDAYKTIKPLIEIRRDNAAILFLKCVATVITLGLAVVFGIWNVKGRELTRNIDDIPALFPKRH